MPAKEGRVAGASLRERHREFAPLVGIIETVEGSVGEASPLTLRKSAGSLHETLAHGLLPHAVGEGRTLFPVLRRVTGTSEAAVSLTRGHREIARLTDELQRLWHELVGTGITRDQEVALRRVLHGLRAHLEEHFEEEEQVCLSVLQAELSPEEAREMVRAMEEATARVRELYE